MDEGGSRRLDAEFAHSACVGEHIHALASRIFPICRSLTGDGVRETLSIINDYLPLKIYSIPTGTQIYDWQAPKEWLIRDAFILDGAGNRIVDFKHNNLHVVNFSVPIRTQLPLSELKKHIHTVPDQPDLIPYRTCYHTDSWGFCMAHNDLLKMNDETYDVVIDAERRDGHLLFGEFVHDGETQDTFLLSTHLCHPSLANDNCSGMALLTHIGAALKSRKTRFTYRLMFGPATYGALGWLKQNETELDQIKHGLVLSCVGDGGGPNYKRSRQGNAEIDQVMAYLLTRSDLQTARVHDFWPYGYDERQFCSPGFNLPIGSFQRSLYGTFRQYHTSADNLAFIKPEYLEQSYDLIFQAIELVERNYKPLNTSPRGEPQLGRRGLFDPIGGKQHDTDYTMALLWVLNLADGEHSLLNIAERANLSFEQIAQAAERLFETGLLVAN
jgi:aminopeptidase-like protein